MEWVNLYGSDKQPSKEEISEYIANPLWEDLNDFLCVNYDTQSKYSYSTCSGQPGWNIKYQKAGRSLCTLYPMKGFYIALVCIGNKEQMEAELILTTLCEYTQKVFNTAGALMGSRWLMLHVTDGGILDDVKRLIQLRRKIKTKGVKSSK